MTDSSLLSEVDITCVRDNIAHYTSYALQWVNTDPPDRDQTALPRHIASIEGLITDLRSIEMSLPAQVFAPLHIHLTHVQDILQATQASTNTLLGQNKRLAVHTLEHTGAMGRPRIACSEQMIIDLHGLGMSERQLAKHLQVSRATLQRRKHALGLRRNPQDALTDVEVQAEVDRCWKEGGGMEGYRLVMAAFARKCITASRAQVRQAIHDLDSDEARRRFAQTTARRVYAVPFANSLWHIDGHHKLIDVKIVIHGGIDGKSRKIVFLKASTNNRAATVYESFHAAVERFGLPSRVRGDYGKENLEVKAFMEAKRGREHHAFIQGPSTRNQRIERFWVDLQWRCTFRYRLLFDQFKAKGILSVENPFDIWCLHLCYLPMLNQSLENTATDWNRHKMDDLGGQSPDLMWWDSVLDADARGIDILADPDAIVGREGSQEAGNAAGGPLAFAEYGLDTYGLRQDGQISPDDPHVEIQPVLGLIPPEIVAALEDPGFQSRLLERIGPWTLGMDDWGEKRYRQCRSEIDEFLHSQFPALFGPG